MDGRVLVRWKGRRSVSEMTSGLTLNDVFVTIERCVACRVAISRLKNRQAYRRTGRPTDRQRHRQTDNEIGVQTSRQTIRHTDMQTTSLLDS